MHSDIDTIERIEILRDLRLGPLTCWWATNFCARGGYPECGLVAILDADKEGFLRSETSLIQTIGRAARNAEGRVIMYADHMTGSMERALAETNAAATSRSPTTRSMASRRDVPQDVDDVMQGLWQGDTDQVAHHHQGRQAHGRPEPCRPSGRPAHRHAQGRREPGIRGRPPACATRSNGWRPWNWRWPTTRWRGNRWWMRRSRRQ